MEAPLALPSSRRVRDRRPRPDYDAVRADLLERAVQAVVARRNEEHAAVGQGRDGSLEGRQIIGYFVGDCAMIHHVDHGSGDLRNAAGDPGVPVDDRQVDRRAHPPGGEQQGQ